MFYIKYLQYKFVKLMYFAFYYIIFAKIAQIVNTMNINFVIIKNRKKYLTGLE